MRKSVAGCASHPEHLLDDVGHDPERESPSEWVWGLCAESGAEGAVEATPVSAESVESADQFGGCTSATDPPSPEEMGSAAVVFELGYDDAVELFLRGLGRCRLSGSDGANCFPGGAAQKQHNPSVVCATGITASGSDLARVR